MLLNSQNSKEKKKEDNLNNLKVCMSPVVHRNKPVLLNSQNSKEKKKDDNLNNLKVCLSPVIHRNKPVLLNSQNSKEKMKDDNLNNLKGFMSPIPKNASVVSLNNNLSEKTGESIQTDGIWASPKIQKKTTLKVSTVDRKPSPKNIISKETSKKVNDFKNYSQSVEKNKEKKNSSINNSQNSANTSNSKNKQLETPIYPNK